MTSMDGDAEDKVIGVGFKTDEGYAHQTGKPLKLGAEENEQEIQFSSDDLTPFESMLLGRVSLINHPEHGRIEVSREKLLTIQPEYASVAFVPVSFIEKKVSYEDVIEKRKHFEEGKDSLKPGFSFLFDLRNGSYSDIAQRRIQTKLIPGTLDVAGRLTSIRLMFVHSSGESVALSDEELSALYFRKEFIGIVDWNKEDDHIKRHEDQSIELIVRPFKNAEVVDKEIH